MTQWPAVARFWTAKPIIGPRVRFTWSVVWMRREQREALAAKGREMKLTVTTPLAIVTEADDVAHLRAEDDSGAFGILPGHADFLTALSLSVVSWRDRRGTEHHLAVRGGMLEVRGGDVDHDRHPRSGCR